MTVKSSAGEVTKWLSCQILSSFQGIKSRQFRPQENIFLPTGSISRRQHLRCPVCRSDPFMDVSSLPTNMPVLSLITEVPVMLVTSWSVTGLQFSDRCQCLVILRIMLQVEDAQLLPALSSLASYRRYQEQKMVFGYQ